MKKLFTLILVLALCLPLCACGGSPLTKDYQTEEELVAALENYFHGKAWKNLDEDEWEEKLREAELELMNNTAIHHYFRKSASAIALAHRLYSEDSLGVYWAPIVFECCNYPDNWYIGIVDTDSASGWPLFFSEWYAMQPTCSSIADEIRDEFTSPMSVYVLEGYFGLCDPVDGVYEIPFEYYGIVKVCAANRLGGEAMQEYVIHGEFDGEHQYVRIVEEFDRPSFDGIRYLSEDLGVNGLFVLK